MVGAVLPETIGNEDREDGDHQRQDAEPSQGDSDEGDIDNRTDRLVVELDGPNSVDLVFAVLGGHSNSITRLYMRIKRIRDFERFEFLAVNFPVVVADHVPAEATRFFVESPVCDLHFLHFDPCPCVWSDGKRIFLPNTKEYLVSAQAESKNLLAFRR